MNQNLEICTAKFAGSVMVMDLRAGKGAMTMIHRIEVNIPPFPVRKMDFHVFIS